MKKTLFEELKKDIRARQFGFRQIIAFTLLSMIVLVFVFFGYSAQDALGVGSAAQVNSTVISAAEYQRELVRVEQTYAPFMQAMGGGSQQRQFVRSQAIENLVNQELAYQAAQGVGISISNQEVIETITREMEVFQDAGRFQRERYEGILRANQWSPAEFERQIRKEKATRRLQAMYDLALQPTGVEVERELQMSKTQKNVLYVSWDAREWAGGVKPKGSELLELLTDPVFAGRVEQEFASRKADLSQPEQIRAQHILIKAEMENPESDKQALAMIKQIKQRLAKEDFAKVAREVSQDEGSKAKGGDLGFFSKGDMVPEFEQVAFTAEPGQVSEPVKSPFGYHLIKVTDKKPAVEAELTNHRESLAAELWAKDQYELQMKKIEELLKSGDHKVVDTLIANWGFKWQESGWFSLADTAAGAISSPVVTERAWTLSEKQPVLNQLVRDGGRVYALKFKAQRTAPDVPKIDELRSTLAQGKSGDMLNRRLEKIKETAKVTRNPQLLQN